MTIVEAAGLVAAGASAASKLLVTFQPFWGKLPRWLAVALPAVVVWLPKFGEAMLGAKSELDIITTAIVSIALLLPGLAEAETQGVA